MTSVPVKAIVSGAAFRVLTFYCHRHSKLCIGDGPRSEVGPVLHSCVNFLDDEGGSINAGQHKLSNS